MNSAQSAKTEFDGRYGIQHGRDYEHYRFQNPDTTKLKQLILDSSPPGNPWGEATLSFESDDHKSQMYILSHPKLGYFLRYGDLSTAYGALSLWDRSLLSTVECPDDLEVSAGLFVPPEAAFSAVSEFFQTGQKPSQIEWIFPSEIPEDGNYV